MTRDTLSGPDNAWRRMGETENLMTITGIMMFDGEVDYEVLCERLEERLLRFERFEQKIGGKKRRFRRPYWETVDNFDIENHVWELALPEPNDQETFEKFVGTLMSRPLDEKRPLWEIYLLKSGGATDGDAMAVRINHEIGDGFALLNVLLGLVDNPEEIEFPIGGISVPPRPDLDDEGEDPDVATANGGTAIQGGESDAVEPTSPDEPAVESEESPTDDADEEDGVEKMRKEAQASGPFGALGTAAKGVKTGVDLLTMDKEPDTSLIGELGPTKRAAWTRNIDLDRLKAIGEEYDATVNDVALGATAGAIRRLLEDRGEDVDDLELQVTIPVNLKPMEDRDESLGNYFGLVFIPLPVGTRDIDDRIDIIHDRMDARKAGIEAYLMYTLLRMGGVVPEIVQEGVMRLFRKKATGIVTNVPGPLNAVEFAGATVDDIIFWVPQANEQGIGVSIISYNGGVRVGVASDQNLIDDPTKLADAFEDELDQLFDDLDDT